MIVITKFEELFSKSNPLQLDSGSELGSVTVAYQSYGELNKDKSNVILVNHALTGNAHAAGIIDENEINNSKTDERLLAYNKMFYGKEGWWDPLIGPGKALDTNKYFVLCSNILGSCYGTTGPVSLNAKTNSIFGINFPKVTVRDMVKVQKSLIDKLGIKGKIELYIILPVVSPYELFNTSCHIYRLKFFIVSLLDNIRSSSECNCTSNFIVFVPISPFESVTVTVRSYGA